MKFRNVDINSRITSFSDPYFDDKSKYVDELLKLQAETGQLVFPKEYKDEYRFKDIIEKLEKENSKNRKVADKEIEEFSKMANKIDKQIKYERSGLQGERMANKSLETILSYNRIIKNITMYNAGHHTEIDNIVITKKAIYIIEVKNTKQDVYIDEAGNYYKILDNNKKYLKNLSENMNDKIFLVNRALQKKGYYGIRIFGIVAFNNGIRINNNCKCLETCYISNLPRRIDSDQGYKYYSNEEINSMASVIGSASQTASYQCPVNIDEYKSCLSAIINKFSKTKNNKVLAIGTAAGVIVSYIGVALLFARHKINN